MKYEDKIYLIGSFTGFRDDIIRDLSHLSLIDARLNPQYAMMINNVTDMDSAIFSTTSIAIFEKNFGHTSFAELGGAHTSGNEILISNSIIGQKPEIDELLESIANEYFTSTKGLREHLSNYELPKKIVRRPKEKYDEVKNILMAGSLDAGLELMANRIEQMNTGKTLHTFSNNILETTNNIRDFEYIVIHFPGNRDYDLKTCFLMGAAYFNKVPMVICDEHKVPYPTLTGGFQRRAVRDLGVLEDYILMTDDTHISKEANTIYQLRQKLDGPY